MRRFGNPRELLRVWRRSPDGRETRRREAAPASTSYSASRFPPGCDALKGDGEQVGTARRRVANRRHGRAGSGAGLDRA